MFNIFQYEKVNKDRKMHEMLEMKEKADKEIHAVRTDQLSSQANMRRLEWASKYITSDFFNSIL